MITSSHARSAIIPPLLQLNNGTPLGDTVIQSRPTAAEAFLKATPGMRSIFIGRQPIYDRALQVFAYELLYRSGEENSAGMPDGDAATSQVILNAFTEIGIENLVGEHLAFINLTRGFIIGDNPLPLTQGKVVLEVLEDIVVDDALIDAVRKLSQAGYLIALDDFIFHESLRPLVDVADIIKIDVRALTRETVSAHVTELRRSKARLLAEKVETQEEFDYYKELGFDYFQGYFFSRPKVIKRHAIPANRLAILRLLGRLHDPEVAIKELEALISQDVSLSYRLLRYINSAFFALPRKVESLHQAIVYLGNASIKTWVTLIALSGIDDKPSELLTVALVRGKMCELLAERLNLPGKDSYFIVGLFSALDAMMDVPLEQVVENLPLSPLVVAALLKHEGQAGGALHCTLAYEKNEWDQIDCRQMEKGVIVQSYLDAVAWADQVMKELA